MIKSMFLCVCLIFAGGAFAVEPPVVDDSSVGHVTTVAYQQPVQYSLLDSIMARLIPDPAVVALFMAGLVLIVSSPTVRNLLTVPLFTRDEADTSDTH